MINAKQLAFLADVLAFREENPARTVSLMFNKYGVCAYLHSAVGSFCSDCNLYDFETDRTFEQAIKEVREYEKTWEETLGEQKLATSYDAEQSGITVGTNA